MTAFDDAFERGYKDAQAGKPRKSNPSFWKGLIKPSYLDDNAKGYKAGFEAGQREKRYAELRAQRAVTSSKANQHEKIKKLRL